MSQSIKHQCLFAIPALVGLFFLWFVIQQSVQVWRQNYAQPFVHSQVHWTGFGRQEILTSKLHALLQRSSRSCPTIQCTFKSLSDFFSSVPEVQSVSLSMDAQRNVVINAVAQQPLFFLQTADQVPLVVTQNLQVFSVGVLKKNNLPLLVLPTISRKDLWIPSDSQAKGYSFVRVFWGFKNLLAALARVHQDLFDHNIGSIQKIEWRPIDGFRLFASDGSIWDLGQDSFSHKIVLLEKLWAYADANQLWIRYADADYNDRVIFRFYDPSLSLGVD